MKTVQLKYSTKNSWEEIENKNNSIHPTVGFIFGSTKLIKENIAMTILKEKFPDTVFIGGTSAGEICGTSVLDDSIIATLVEFESTKIKYVSCEVNDVLDSFNVGEKIISSLLEESLKHVFVISEGLQINGSELVRGLRSKLPIHISATGGLAGDGANFSETYILDENGMPKNKLVSAIGFYGDKLHVSYGSLGGWDSFGVERLVTKSNNNVLFELDGKPALELYKSFLGEHAANLPSSGLLFPLNLRESDGEPVVRTILAVDETNQSLTFAGDIPEGSYVRLMKANFDRLIEGAMGAAKGTLKNAENDDPSLAVLISCVGRKLVLKQIIEEEVEAVEEILGKSTRLCGFYSYGEISPFNTDARCELHNQTMTITTFNEVE